MSYLGIDVGTNAIKAVMIDSSGNIIFEKSIDYKIYFNNCYAEENPYDWINGFKKIMESLPERPESMAFTGQMHTFVITDDYEKPLRNAILWSDFRGYKYSQFLIKKYGLKNLINETGNYPLSNFSLLKLLWIKYNEKQNFKKMKNAFMAKDFVKYYLTGKKSIDVTDASGTYLLNVKKRSWTRIFEHLDIYPEIFGDLNESYDTDSYYDGIEIRAGAGDQEASAIGMGLGPNDLGITLGTSGVVFKLLKEYKIPKNNSLHLFCHAQKNKWHLMGVTQSGALSLKWINSILNLDYKESEKLAMSSDPGSNGILFFPYLNGERSPFNSSTVRASFSGISSGSSRNDIIRSVMEGIAFNLKHVYKEMNQGAEKIVISGGGAESKLLVQIISDVFNKTVYLGNVNSTAYGAALISMGHDVKQDYHEVFEPSQNAALYRELFLKYLRSSSFIRKI